MKMAKKPTKTIAVVAKGNVPAGRFLAGTSIPPLEVYHVPEVHPKKPGPWSAEPDKVSWIDPATGSPCIVRRESNGALHGYVGIGPDHPFHGVDYQALPHDPPIVVHGGVNYSESCEERERPSRSVCHVPAAATTRRHTASAAAVSRPLGSRAPSSGSAASPTTVVDVPDNLWWFGFGCDHVYDIVPDGYQRALAAETGASYRDEAYLVRETTNLAAQLHAIANGRPMPPLDGDRPGVGLDPFSPTRRA
ncbi:hypothetical protein [Sphingomonas bacterium]|uniref:hypothetical protein n=1 Tax=Sphingomonas bacterium TaxID=1895847 RepID=UPI0015774DD9|nr:hypothetical protein [Sphingomonas bacterium]